MKVEVSASTVVLDCSEQIHQTTPIQSDGIDTERSIAR